MVGEGPSDADLVLVGEAPGRLEDEAGHPFVGRSGRLLLELLEASTGLTRDDVFITNTVRCRPPGNRTPSRGEQAACSTWLTEELALLQPKVIVGVGQVATRALLGRSTTMREVHGTTVSSDRFDRLVVPAYHPAAALRGGPSVVEALRGDLAAAGRVVGAAAPW